MEYLQLRECIDRPESRLEVSAVELAESFLARIAVYQPTLNCFISVTPEIAVGDARQVDAARQRGEPLPLDGMPIALKDNIDVAGVRTTVASKFFQNNIPTKDAEVVRRLRMAGAVLVGKAALHEFVFGATTNNPAPYGACRNPWELSRIPGGSSGGSGVAIAADLCIGALGTDTGGSVRIPASLNGVTGLRPTFGRVSTTGVFPCAPTFDEVGPMARSVKDVAKLLAAITGYDFDDPRSVEVPTTDAIGELDQGLDGIRVGIPQSFFFDGVDPDIADGVLEAANVLREAGASVSHVDVPTSRAICDATATIVRAEALALHRKRYDEHPELFGEEIRRRFELGEQLRGWEVAASYTLLYEWRRDLRRLFQNIDIALSPTTKIVAPPIEGSESISISWDLTFLTYPWSLGALPALSMPCGFSKSGLPFGVQLAAAPWRESLLLRAGACFQSATDWHLRRPAIAASLPVAS